MEIVRRIHSMKEVVRDVRGRGLSVGFVPTMGCLHEGHLSLIRQVNERSDVVIVSIFVNPTQFGPDEDYERYPRDLTRDADLCIAEGVEYLFTPEAKDIYPEGAATLVDVENLSRRWEGRSRPGHFQGVATVVLKLLNIIRPDVAAFGQKDAQQVAVVRRMVQDLHLDVEILVGPIVRDDDGLALSSRNRYLTEEDRKAVAAIPMGIDAVEQAVEIGERDADRLQRLFESGVGETGRLRTDYAALVDPDTLEPLETLDRDALFLVAVFCGDLRLLDNRRIELPEED